MNEIGGLMADVKYVIEGSAEELVWATVFVHEMLEWRRRSPNATDEWRRARSAEAANEMVEQFRIAVNFTVAEDD